VGKSNGPYISDVLLDGGWRRSAGQQRFRAVWKSNQSLLGRALHRSWDSALSAAPPAGSVLSLIAVLFNFAGSAMTTITIFRDGDAPVHPLVFFGMYCLLIGILILRSTFLPHALGILTAAAGIGWFVFLAPLHIHFLTVSIEVIGFTAEAALMLWLLLKGVDEQKWFEQTAC
jgi:hypothetical protein